nr:hypothetical protein CFP56_58238 [Quercus suber]
MLARSHDDLSTQNTPERLVNSHFPRNARHEPGRRVIPGEIVFGLSSLGCHHSRPATRPPVSADMLDGVAGMAGEEAARSVAAVAGTEEGGKRSRVVVVVVVVVVVQGQPLACLDLEAALLVVRFLAAETRILADHAAGEGALDLGAEGELTDLLALVRAQHVALAVEARVVHAVKGAGPGLDVGGLGVVAV